MVLGSLGPHKAGAEGGIVEYIMLTFYIIHGNFMNTVYVNYNLIVMRRTQFDLTHRVPSKFYYEARVERNDAQGTSRL